MRSAPVILLPWALLCGCSGAPQPGEADRFDAAAAPALTPSVTGSGATGSDDGMDPAPPSVAPEPPAFVSTATAATPTLMRLSGPQWANTIRDLLELPDPGQLDDALTQDAVVRFDNEADSLFVGQDLHNDLQSEAERLAALVVSDPASLARLVPTGAPADLAGKARAFLREFGRRAYRRPLTEAELSEYVALFDQGPALTTGLGAFEAGVRVTLEAFLQSPLFLYRTAIGGAAVEGRARLTDYEIATNLAYALTDHPPDALLSAAADAGALDSADAITKHAQRLIATDAGKLAVDRFFFQYFGLGQYDTLQKDPAIAPEFSDTTGPLLHEEEQRLLAYLFAQNLGLREIFTSSVGFVNAALAKLYDIPGTFDADTWTQVTFDPEQRPGILTRLGFVSYFGYQDRPNSIKRGANINSRILCNELSPPPNIVLPPLPEPDPDQTNRQVIEGITEGCGAACHVPFINPAGFSLENFDGLGRYRESEHGMPIDASGTYRFTEGEREFSNVVEFTQALAESSQAHGCYTKKLASNLFARQPRKGDEELAHRLALRSIEQHLSSRDLVLALISDEAFVTRVEVAP